MDINEIIFVNTVYTKREDIVNTKNYIMNYSAGRTNEILITLAIEI